MYIIDWEYAGMGPKYYDLAELTISKLDFDYYGYGETKYRNAMENFKFIQAEYGISR